MRKFLVVGVLAALVVADVACSSDDATVADNSGGQGGSGGAGGTGGAKATGGGGATTSTTSGAGGAVDGGKGDAGSDADAAGGAGGAAGGAGGTGGAGGSIGGGGTGGTDDGGVIDPCVGKYNPLPFVVANAFTNLRICSAGSCNATQPYFFTPIPNPNCDEVFPDGGIVPPFQDAGDDAGPGDDGGADAGAADTNDAGAAADASPDVSAGDDAGSESGAITTLPAGPPCYEFLYNPNCGGTCWGGVIFTQSAGSDMDPGVCITPGATRITFWAKASRPDARIKFGSIRPGLGTTEFFLMITTEWAPYQITIPADEPYNSYSAGGTGVWNGFSVIVEPQDHPGGTYIFVKDAVWWQ